MELNEDFSERLRAMNCWLPTGAFFQRAKRYAKSVAIVAFLALFGFVVFHVGAASYSNYPKQQQHDKPETCAQSCAPQQPPLSALWDWTTHDPVAFYTSVLSVFTALLFVSTVGLWHSTRRGIRVQTDDTRILQRAYLSVKPLGLEPYRAGPFISCDVIFENVGHLPARKVRWFVDRVFNDERYFNDLEIKQERFAGENVITPGTEMIRSARALDIETFQAAQMRTGDNQYFYIWGEVRYDDGFGNSRFTKFCHRYNFAGVGVSGGNTVAPKYARYHEYGNDAD